jgi:murein DD-endopeptidase MepM/ murein hydrolase activator NlpD
VDRALPIAIAGLLLSSTIVSALPGGPTGGLSGDGSAPRIAIGGGPGDGLGRFDDRDDGFVPYRDLRQIDPDAYQLGEEPEDPGRQELIGGPFLGDGTLLKPVSVHTSVADGSALLARHTVRTGDTLTGIAKEHGVSMMTVWWANKLTTKDDLKVGQVLTVPTVNGIIVTVAEGDTLESLAAEHKADPDEIHAVNGLEDPVLVMGQLLVIPGAVGDPIPTPKPTATRAPTVRAPTTSTRGTFVWPVVGGNNYVSQYFRYGHYAIDIAAQHGSTVRAAGAGKVMFAGWKNNGGGYQVWITHGSGLYTLYAHLSALTVGTGQQVGRGQQVGMIGRTGRATGPHLHFEVWRGAIWDTGGRRVNPLLYL